MTGPHVATVIFVVLMLSAAAIGLAGYLADSDSASGDTPVGLVPESNNAQLDARSGSNGAAESDQPSGSIGWPDAPETSAVSVFAIDTATGEVVYAKNEDEERDIASTVKIMTALVTVDFAELDDEVFIEDEDLVDMQVYSNMALFSGDTLTVEQLLTGLLIPSGSDGALALARYVGGLIDPDSDDPESAFVDAMNARAESLGMTNSHFTNPDGNDSKNAYSSARDIATAGVELLKQPVLAEIVSQTAYTFTSVGPEAREYTGVTTNQLLTEGYDGVSGIKTGSTEAAGGCIVVAQENPKSGSTIVIAVLGSDLTYENGWIAADSRWDDTRALLAWIDGQK